ncbi:MAG: LmbU family transcriptional regulator [Streptosporangiaceae bacterium]
MHIQNGSPIKISRRGLRFPQKLSFERWINIGQHLSDISSSSAWCLGDWLAYGETAFTGRYRSAIEQTSLDYQTLRNYAWVAKRFSLSRRQETLSFGHHAEVAALPEPEQDFWLRKAELFHWSVKHLRHEVRTSLRERAIGCHSQPEAISGKRQARPPETGLNIQITSDKLAACEAAAQGIGLSLEQWVALALEQAVRCGLDL